MSTITTQTASTPKASGCHARAVVFDAPGKLSVQSLRTAELEPGDLLVDVHASGISTGTERLLWNGEMPDFPGMGYPLIPGYESVGEIQAVGSQCDRQVGEFVFVGGSQSFPTMRSLFGGAASHLVVPQQKAVPIDSSLGTNGLLLALAATAHHVLFTDKTSDSELFVPPDLIIGHGVLGRLLARICLALDFAAPTVWEIEQVRRQGASDYQVIDPHQDRGSTYQHIVDVSGNSDILDTAIMHLRRRKSELPPPQITLAGFYKDSLSFQFAAAFMKEVRIQIAAEWQAEDMQAVSALVKTGALSLDGLITHTAPVDDAAKAYETAFSDQNCLKMALDWRNEHE